MPLPEGWGNSVWSLACDGDGSVWVGFGYGNIGRLTAAGWAFVPDGIAPRFVQNTVRSISIDRWATPRIVYFAHLPGAGRAGGVTAYAGP